MIIIERHLLIKNLNQTFVRFSESKRFVRHEKNFVVSSKSFVRKKIHFIVAVIYFPEKWADKATGDYFKRNF